MAMAACLILCVHGNGCMSEPSDIGRIATVHVLVSYAWQQLHALAQRYWLHGNGCMFDVVCAWQQLHALAE